MWNLIPDEDGKHRFGFQPHLIRRQEPFLQKSFVKHNTLVGWRNLREFRILILTRMWGYQLERNQVLSRCREQERQLTLSRSCTTSLTEFLSLDVRPLLSTEEKKDMWKWFQVVTPLLSVLADFMMKKYYRHQAVFKQSSVRTNFDGRNQASAITRRGFRTFWLALGWNRNRKQTKLRNSAFFPWRFTVLYVFEELQSAQRLYTSCVENVFFTQGKKRIYKHFQVCWSFSLLEEF